jgi:anti-anti-sigma factor
MTRDIREKSMFEFSVAKDGGLKTITVKGRIDALSSAELQKGFDTLILAGERVILVNFAEVHYISSAGLRVFLSVQKQLKRVGGEIVLLKPVSSVLEVFKTSGLDQLFRIATTEDEIATSLLVKKANPEVMAKEVEGIAMEYFVLPADKGSLFVIGSQGPLAESGYTEQDVATVKTGDIQFGAGLAALGETFKDYKHLFGESMVINQNFFVYPAIKHSAVDFMMETDSQVNLTYKFLHGFGFTGHYRYILSFEGKGRFAKLEVLLNALFHISQANVLGVCFYAESKGLFGLNLKRVPILEQKPDNGKEIFDSSNFFNWMDFAVEPTDLNHITAGTGIAIRDRNLVSPPIQTLFSEGGNFHIHAGIFSKGPFSQRLDDFEKELTRILTELEAYKIQHLLGQSEFARGIVGIIEIEG